MYTRCPKCSTCFRVTDRHLAIANGKVRCGKCQLVFNATENAIDDLPSKQAGTATFNQPNVSVTPAAKPEIKKPLSSPPEAKVATPTKNKIETPVKTTEVQKAKSAVVPPPKVAPPIYKADATMVIDDIHKEEFKHTQQAKSPNNKNTSKEDEDVFHENIDLNAAIDALTHDADEVTYDSLVGKDEKRVNSEVKNDVFTTDAYDATNATSVADILSEMEGQLALNIPEPENNINKEHYDADDEFEFIELDDEPETTSKKSVESNDEFIKNNFDLSEFNLDDDLDDFLDDDIEAESNDKIKTESVQQKKIKEEEESFDEFDLSSFDNNDVEDEVILEDAMPNIGQHADTKHKPDKNDDANDVPYQLRGDIDRLQAPAQRRLHPLLKFTFVVFLIGLSFVQLAYFRSHELVSIIPSSRPLLEQFCENVGCQYSGPSDTKQIQLISRDVRQHPKENKALLISAAMVNNAYFAQPYPNIHVRLSDISGNVVAERIFNPKTYMGKLSNPFLLMRSKTPVHINFEVVDPGKDAVNFEFTFL